MIDPEKLSREDQIATEPAPTVENLKLAINNLLWMHMPPETTLAKAEAFLQEIFSRIETAWLRAGIELE